MDISAVGIARGVIDTSTVVARDRCCRTGVFPGVSGVSSGEETSLDDERVDCLEFAAEGVGDLSTRADEVFSASGRDVGSVGEGRF